MPADETVIAWEQLKETAKIALSLLREKRKIDKNNTKSKLIHSVKNFAKKHSEKKDAQRIIDLIDGYDFQSEKFIRNLQSILRLTNTSDIEPTSFFISLFDSVIFQFLVLWGTYEPIYEICAEKLDKFFLLEPEVIPPKIPSAISEEARIIISARQIARGRFFKTDFSPFYIRILSETSEDFQKEFKRILIEELKNKEVKKELKRMTEYLIFLMGIRNLSAHVDGQFRSYVTLNPKNAQEALTFFLELIAELPAIELSLKRITDILSSLS